MILFGLFHIVSAQSSFIQSYKSNSSLNQGIIVQLVPKNSSEIEPATQANSNQAFGVVVNAQDASLVFSNANSPGQTYIATGGNYNVLVSNQNGKISSGNYITLSSLNGIGMKDNNTQPIVVGQALDSFSGKNAISSVTVTTSTGTKQTVEIGLIQVSIDFKHNPLQEILTGDVPPFLARLSSGVASGKTVPPWRIYVGVGILFATIIIAGIILYGGVKSSLISIGRNPLSKRSIVNALIEVTLIALIIFIVGIFGVYLLLRL